MFAESVVQQFEKALSLAPESPGEALHKRIARCLDKIAWLTGPTLETDVTEPLEIMFFDNGNTAAFHGGKQVPELQRAWFNLFLNWIDGAVDPAEVVFTMPDGRRAKVIKTESGFNWQFRSND